MGSCPAQPAQRSHAAPGGWGGSGGSQPELPRPSPPPRADGHGCTPSHSGVCGGGRSRALGGGEEERVWGRAAERLQDPRLHSKFLCFGSPGVYSEPGLERKEHLCLAPGKGRRSSGERGTAARLPRSLPPDSTRIPSLGRALLGRAAAGRGGGRGAPRGARLRARPPPPCSRAEQRAAQGGNGAERRGSKMLLGGYGAASRSHRSAWQRAGAVRGSVRRGKRMVRCARPRQRCGSLRAPPAVRCGAVGSVPRCGAVRVVTPFVRVGSERCAGAAFGGAS